MKIELEGMLNVRDLGGMIGDGGRKIKTGRVLRSDNLSCATERDCEFLREYGLKKIVDFRTEDEIASSPDREISGVEWIKNPILESLTAGITRKEDKAQRCLEEILLDFSIELGEGGKEWLAGLYVPLVSDGYCLNAYRRFLDVLKDNRDGAVLYHCSAGKDRVGVGTAIFLSILGVKREDIIKDYLRTNESYKAAITAAQELGRARGVAETILETIEPLSGVDVSYITAAFDVIDNKFGGFDCFLANQLKIDEFYVKELKYNYLTLDKI